jgi:thiosulfate reductase cytochrome b subunit
MKKSKFKKILWASLSTVVFLVTVLAVHIYMVTRPKAPDATTKIMARLDFKQGLKQDDADKITAWLYNQNGVDHVLCNQKSGIAVFTFYPVKTSANKITSDMRYDLHYTVNRYMPTKEEMQGGCPVGAGSVSSKIYSSVTNLFN